MRNRSVISFFIKPFSHSLAKRISLYLAACFTSLVVNMPVVCFWIDRSSPLHHFLSRDRVPSHRSPIPIVNISLQYLLLPLIHVVGVAYFERYIIRLFLSTRDATVAIGDFVRLNWSFLSGAYARCFELAL